MSYKVDPNNNLKMIPKTKVSKDAYGFSINPASETIQERPSYVLFNVVKHDSERF